MIKVFASEMRKHALGPLVREHVIYRMRHPDPGSTFDQLNKEIRHIDDDTAIGGLLQNGYEGILFVSDSRKEVVGDTFFHLRGEGMELHLFACKVHERQRKQGIGTRLVKAFFEHSWQRHIRKVRVSKGNHEYVFRILQNAFDGKISFSDFRVEPLIGDGVGWARLVA